MSFTFGLGGDVSSQTKQKCIRNGIDEANILDFGYSMYIPFVNKCFKMQNRFKFV